MTRHRSRTGSTKRSARCDSMASRSTYAAAAYDYDCLGTGVYFFEDGLTQARAWAERAHPGEPAVVEADVRLEDCIDLKDSVGWVPVLAQAHDELLRTRREQGVPVPDRRAANTGSTARSLSSRLRSSSTAR
jgi:hypothetical protein